MMAVDHSRVYRRQHGYSSPVLGGGGGAATTTDCHDRVRPNLHTLKGTLAAAAARPTQRRKKSVRFHVTVKQHDGLTPHKRVYDEVVHDLFNRPDDRYRTIRDVVNSADVAILERLQVQLVDLMKRCSEGKTPVLNCGGGRNNVVDERFAPWLRKLATRVEEHVDMIQEQEAVVGSLEEVVRMRLGEEFRI